MEWPNKPVYLLCSEHFTFNCFEDELHHSFGMPTVRRLKKIAVSTIFKRPLETSTTSTSVLEPPSKRLRTAFEKHERLREDNLYTVMLVLIICVDCLQSCDEWGTEDSEAINHPTIVTQMSM